jgi:hypothetical protein
MSCLRPRRPFAKIVLFAFIVGALLVTLPAGAQATNGGAASGGVKAAASFSDLPQEPSGGAASTAPSEPGAAPVGTRASQEAAPVQPQAPAPGATPAPDRAAPAAANIPVDGATYAVRLRDLEARVDELKEQIRRSHTRLSLLSDTILAGGIGGARAEIVLVNELSGAFRIVRALVVLDGAVQYNKQDDEDALGDQAEVPIFSGAIPAGDHTVQVLLKIQGHGYGVFSYLRGYVLEPKSSHSFTVTDGKTVQLRVIAWEKGGVTTPLEQRPTIRYVEKLRTDNEGKGAGGNAGSR